MAGYFNLQIQYFGGKFFKKIACWIPDFSEREE